MLQERLEEVERRIAAAAARSGRGREAITLVAASKHQEPPVIEQFIELCRERGLPVVLGESYVQEYKRKKDLLPAGYTCHLIGALQRNKARDAVALFDVIESIHSAPVAQAVHAAAEKASRRQEVFLEVNVSGDTRKAGFLPAALPPFIVEVLPALSGISVTGLMTITAQYDRAEDVRGDYRALRGLAGEVQALMKTSAPLQLSMGMSDDFEIAIEEGATIVRIGTALFGQR